MNHDRLSTTVRALAVSAALALPVGATAPLQESEVTTLGKPVAEGLQPLLEEIEWTSPRYVAVRDGWLSKRSIQLFEALSPELFPPKKFPQPIPLPEPVEAIHHTMAQLERAGVELLVVPIPTRLNIYPDAVAELELDGEFHGYAPGLAKLFARLRARDVEVLDLLPPLAAQRADLDSPADTQVYLRANAHWSPKGAAIAATTIAENLRARPWFEDATSPTNLESYSATWAPADMELAEGVEPPVLTFERVVDAAGEPVERTDTASPIVLWGDSFTTIYEAEGADLARRLHHLLGAPVDVVASSGGGPHASRAAFARRRDALEGKRIVVWSFAARTLMGKDWERVKFRRP